MIQEKPISAAYSKECIELGKELSLTLVLGGKQGLKSQKEGNKIYFVNDVIAGQSGTNIEGVTFSEEFSEEKDQTTLKISFNLEIIKFQDKAYIKTCKQNIGRLIFKLPNNNGSDIYYSLALMIIEENGNMFSAFLGL